MKWCRVPTSIPSSSTCRSLHRRGKAYDEGGMASSGEHARAGALRRIPSGLRALLFSDRVPAAIRSHGGDSEKNDPASVGKDGPLQVDRHGACENSPAFPPEGREDEGFVGGHRVGLPRRVLTFYAFDRAVLFKRHR